MSTSPDSTMRRYDPLDDLLRHQRRRNRDKKRVLLLAFVLILGGAGVFWLFASDSELVQDFSTAAPVEDGDVIAVAAAQGVVEGSIFAATEPLEVVPAESAEEAAERDAAELTAMWKDGESVTMRGKIEPNQSLFLALQNRQVPVASIHEAVTAMSTEFNFRKSRPGDTWLAELGTDGKVAKLEYSTSPEDIWQTVRDQDGAFETAKVEVPIETRQKSIDGTIQSSLWLSFEAADASPNLIASYMDLFAYTIDFNSETQTGDAFKAVYEEVYLDGKHLRDGRVLAAKYAGEAGTFYGFYHEDDKGNDGYYDENGDNLKRQFLKSPIPIVRITSKFGRRFHPVLKKMKMHAGVDYGAPTGTPVLAAADGKIIYAGWKGANGKLVSIRHANGYITHYAHLSKIERGIKRGARVKQKQQIGRIGSTGRSTGPHLHYGMVKNGRHVNPLEVDFARAEPLKGADKKRFLESVVEPMKARLDKL